MACADRLFVIWLLAIARSMKPCAEQMSPRGAPNGHSASSLGVAESRRFTPKSGRLWNWDRAGRDTAALVGIEGRKSQGNSSVSYSKIVELAIDKMLECRSHRNDVKPYRARGPRQNIDTAQEVDAGEVSSAQRSSEAESVQWRNPSHPQFGNINNCIAKAACEDDIDLVAPFAFKSATTLTLRAVLLSVGKRSVDCEACKS